MTRLALSAQPGSCYPAIFSRFCSDEAARRSRTLLADAAYARTARIPACMFYFYVNQHSSIHRDCKLWHASLGKRLTPPMQTGKKRLSDQMLAE